MARRPHHISKSSADAQPARLVSLAIDVSRASPATDPHTQHESLIRWHSCGWACERDGYRREWACGGTDPERWWRALIWATKRPGITWVVAHRAVRVLTVLGAWARLDKGEVCFDGQQQEEQRVRMVGSDVPVVFGDAATRRHDDGRYIRGAVPELPAVVLRTGGVGLARPAAEGRAAPFLALDDPPTVITLRAPGMPGRLRIVDVRNYGIDAGPWEEPCAALAEWLRDAMRRMVDALTAHQWGGLCATAGSQAMRCWRRRYMSCRVQAHTNETASELERQAYVGGRCECAFIGAVSSPVWVVDVRSMYPYVCATVHLPVSIQGQGTGPLPVLSQGTATGSDCIAEVSIETDDPDYPATQARPATWPVGRLTTTLAGPELSDALASGRVCQIHRWTQYDMRPALMPYALAMYSARCAAELDGDRALSQWLKKLLVALPGKLGQREFRWHGAPEVRPRAQWMAWIESHHEHGMSRLRSLSGMVQRQTRGGWANDAVPAMAAWIMSAARIHLLRGIRIAGRSNVYYWDTDSLFLSQEGLERLSAVPGMVGDSMGQWGIRKYAERCEIKGIKHYVLDGSRTCAGLPRLQDRDVAMLDRYWYRQTFGVALGNGHAPDPVRRLQRYERQTRYTLGYVGPDGWVTPQRKEDW